MMSHILLQEGDEICYRAAFACEKTRYRLHYNRVIRRDIEDCGELTKTEIIKLMQPQQIDIDYTLEMYKEIDPEHIVLATLDQMILRLWALSNHPEAQKYGIYRIEDIQFYLSPADHSNFRYSRATIPGPKGVGYKQGRGEKPAHLQLIREYLKAEYDAEECPGLEADDALGICAKEGTIISSIDKDLNMIPGLHYNHVKQELYEVSEFEGVYNFYRQMLTGDPTDNIPGCRNPNKEHYKNKPCYTNKTADEYLFACVTEADLFMQVFIAYVHVYKQHSKEVMYEIADLLWISRDGSRGSDYLKLKRKEISTYGLR